MFMLLFHWKVGSVRVSHWAVAVADFDLSRSSNRARFAWGKLRSLPTKARPIISLDPVAARETQAKLEWTTGRRRKNKAKQRKTHTQKTVVSDKDFNGARF